ncbi:MAG: hypothetical protein C0596_11165 [Marinilabiliales bacterium]|nr:MAG: hypothetical protein C0596_11165 [Marinilabiliales bacterium]
MLNLYNELILNGKKPIAVRILGSTLRGSCALQQMLQTDKRREYKESAAKAVKNLKNVVYWIEQCEKSGYYFNEQLLQNAHEILELCQMDEFVI